MKDMQLGEESCTYCLCGVVTCIWRNASKISHVLRTKVEQGISWTTIKILGSIFLTLILVVLSI